MVVPVPCVVESCQLSGRVFAYFSYDLYISLMILRAGQRCAVAVADERRSLVLTRFWAVRRTG